MNRVMPMIRVIKGYGTYSKLIGYMYYYTDT